MVWFLGIRLYYACIIQRGLKQGLIFIISLGGEGGGGGGGGGGVWTNRGLGPGGVIFSPHSHEFFPDIGLLARRNFDHTIQDLL